MTPRITPGQTMAEPPPPLVAAVVLNWNKARDSVACVHALHAQTHANLRVIVVDNGSAPGSVQPLEALGDSILLLRNQENLGFAGGVNVGITRAMTDGADFIWLVNNDALPEPGALALMLRSLQDDPAIGLASPTILNGDANDEIEFCGGVWEADSFKVTNDPGTYRRWHARLPDQVWLVGTALLLRRALVERIGLFDEHLFAYWEDNDYALRCMRAGYRSVMVPEAVVRHWSGAPMTDPGTKPPHYYYYMARNEVILLRKHLPFPAVAKPLAWALSRQFRQVARLHAFPHLADALLRGLYDGLRGSGGGYHPGRRLPAAAAAPLRRLAAVLHGR